MITYLKIRNLAIVEEFEIEPGGAFNVLTGETGAGKSLLIDSLEFLTGARGTSESVRTGEDRMVAEAVFHLPSTLRGALDEQGIEAAENNDALEVIVKRDFSRTGRGRVSVNGSVITVRELQELGGRLIEIHGQNESQERIAGRSFRDLLDHFGGHDDLVMRAADHFAAYRKTAADLRQLSDQQKDRSLKLDLLQYQIREISEARLHPGEEEELRSERSLLANAHALITATASAFGMLQDDEDSAVEKLARSAQLLNPLIASVESIEKIHGELDELRYRLQDISRSIADIGASVRIDPERLDEIEDRLVTIERLKKKYGPNIEAILQHFELSAREHEQLSDFETSLGRLENDNHGALTRYQNDATLLSQNRAKAARAFEAAVQKELGDLAMEGTTIRVAIATAREEGSPLIISGHSVAFGSDGYDRIELLIAPNKGEELRPLARIASGGELSRIQLAIVTALFKQRKSEGAATLVFDEIDSGVGGNIAEVIGRKLQEIAADHQVLCVTHLPQIASMAQTHFRVWKEDVDGRTRARIEKLEGRQERIAEIARMLGGEAVVESARRHAAELLDQSAPRARKGRLTVAVPKG
ncbi:MAG TPA: DNA repair protein RecN [Thermoanaerobaculia bacterium]|nr:DNA repair protein RecN [Thermoanaerobaculia bacterium]